MKLIISTFLRYQFSMWSHDVIATSILLAGDLKLGQYCKAFFSLCSYQKSHSVNFDLVCSKNPTPCDGSHSSLGHYFGMFCQLRRHDPYRH